MKPQQLKLIAELIKEASSVIRSIPIDVFEALEVRYFLSDELEGSAFMLLDEIDEIDEPS